MSEELAVEQPTEEQLASEEQAAFESVFDSKRGDTVPAETEDTTTDPAPTEPEVISEETVPEAPIYAGMTETELKAKLARIDELEAKLSKSSDTVTGKIGVIYQQLEQLKNGQKKEDAKSVSVKLPKLQESYEELAQLLAEDLAPVLSQRTPVDVDARLNEAISKQSQELKETFLSMAHPDWKETLASPDFQQWKDEIGEEKSEALFGSDDMAFIAKSFTEFKDWRTNRSKQQSAAEEAARIKQEKKQRLEAAALPNGVPPSQTQVINSEEDAFLATLQEGAAKRRRR